MHLKPTPACRAAFGRALLAAGLLLPLAACQPSGPTAAPEGPPTEVLPPTGLPDPSTIAAPVGELTAEEVAQMLYQAWVKGDLAAAQPLVDPTAQAGLDALFALPFDPAAGWAYDHCEGAAGSVFCSWHSPDATLIIQVRSIEPPVQVTSIRVEAGAAP